MNQHASLENARREMSTWLAPFGLSLEVDSKELLSADVLGSYEGSSVFEKNILVHVNLPAIKRTCAEDPFEDRYSDVASVTKTTLYHEVGHALLEQIIDWMENLPDAGEVFNDAFCTKYDAVVDDALPEEELVEEFAWNWLLGRPDPLKSCFEELNQKLGVLST